MKLYIWIVGCLLGILLVVTVGWNMMIDPYRVFFEVQPIEYFEPNIRLWKTAHLRAEKQKYNGLILGNSRAAQLPPDSINTESIHFYNYATSSECLNETYRKLQYIYGFGASLTRLPLLRVGKSSSH